MRIVRIFASAEKLPGSWQIAGLFAMRYPEMPENENAWSELIGRLKDAEYLTGYFSLKRALISYGYYKGISVTGAVEHTLQEMIDLERWLRGLEQEVHDPFNQGLEDAFRLLENYRTRHSILEKVKAKNRINPRWIRVYAIRVSPGFYIITGGGIKLVERMQDDPDLDRERRKLERVRDWLIEHGLYDPEHYAELEL